MLHIKLRELRELKELTQTDIAQVLQITRGAYSMYESNKRQMNYESLCLLADFFDVTTDYLLGREAQDMMLLTDSEKEIMIKYRDLDERGKENINGLLDIEHSRLKSKKDSAKKVM